MMKMYQLEMGEGIQELTKKKLWKTTFKKVELL